MLWRALAFIWNNARRGRRDAGFAGAAARFFAGFKKLFFFFFSFFVCAFFFLMHARSGSTPGNFTRESTEDRENRLQPVSEWKESNCRTMRWFSPVLLLFGA